MRILIKMWKAEKFNPITGSRIDTYSPLLQSIAYVRNLDIVCYGDQLMEENEEW